jgi:hypothetical protein
MEPPLLKLALKAWKLPASLFSLMANIAAMPGRNNQGPRWHLISKTPLVKTIAVAHGSRIVLEGKIVTVTGEKKNPALVQIDFPGFVAGDELARQLRISFSKRAGFYKYLPVHNPG